MFQIANLRLFWLVCLLSVLFIGVIGCGDDDDNWVGTWYLASVAGHSWEDLKPNTWTFYEDGTFEGQFGPDTYSGIYFLSGSEYTMISDKHTRFEDTGRWHRKGNTITLFSHTDDDGIFIYKKK